jgi:hypothetical protein
MANMIGLAPCKRGAIRMALLAEKPRAHTMGLWERPQDLS